MALKRARINGETIRRVRRADAISADHLVQSGDFVVLGRREPGFETFSTSAPLIVPSENPTIIERIGEAVIDGVSSFGDQIRRRMEKHPKATVIEFDDEGRAKERTVHAWYVERRDSGSYSVKRGNASRASAIEGTQSAAIDRARSIDPNAPIHVERVRDADSGSRDKWRKG